MPDTTPEFAFRFPETTDPATIATYFANLAQDVEDALVAKNLDDLSAFFQTLIDDANAGAVLTTLGISAFIQTLLNDADQNAAAATLGVLRDINDVIATSHIEDAAVTSEKALVTTYEDVQTATIAATGALTGISVTPEAGRYLCIATAELRNTTSGDYGRISLRQAGSNIIDGPRSGSIDFGSDFYWPLIVQGFITFNGSQALEVYFTDSGSASGLQITNGRLSLHRVS